MEEEKQEGEEEAVPENQEENPQEEPSKEEEPEAEVDFAKELENLEDKKPQRTELEKATYTAKQIAARIKELGGDPAEIFPQKEERQEFVTKEDMAKSYVRSITRSEEEAKVVLWHYRNSIQRTGNIEEDIDNAHLLANKSRLKRFASEVERKEIPGKGTGAGQKMPVIQAPEMSREDQFLLSRRGLKFNAKTKEWEGKHNVVKYDPTAKAWVTIKKVTQ